MNCHFFVQRRALPRDTRHKYDLKPLRRVTNVAYSPYAYSLSCYHLLDAFAPRHRAAHRRVLSQDDIDRNSTAIRNIVIANIPPVTTPVAAVRAYRRRVFAT